MRKHLPTILVATAASAILVVSALWLRAAGTPPVSNVVLITVEGVRGDRVGEATPELARIAAQGVHFRQATTPLPRTTPALGSILTGLWPHHHGSRDDGVPVRFGRTLAQDLQAGLHRTLGISVAQDAGHRQDLARGFDRFAGAARLRRYAKRELDGGSMAEAAAEVALEMVSETAHGRAVFLWVHLGGPAFPYAFEGASASTCQQPMRRYRRSPRDRSRVVANVDSIASEHLAACERAYAAALSELDRAIGRLLRGLEDQRRLRSTYLAVAGTHGQTLGEDGLYFAAGDTVHDASIRVPMVLSGPGLARAAVDADPASLEDLTPTLLELLDRQAGQPPAARPFRDGRSLVGRSDTRQGAVDAGSVLRFSEAGTPRWNDSPALISTGTADERHCIHDDAFSLCRRPGKRPALFDRRTDPKMLTRVDSAHPDRLSALQEAWERWPPGTARQRSVRDGRYKLVRRPVLSGGWRDVVYDLVDDPEESLPLQVGIVEPARQLVRSLDQWSEQLERSPTPGGGPSHPEPPKRGPEHEGTPSP
jgi:arylsulfatase A-like enzyme